MMKKNVGALKTRQSSERIFNALNFMTLSIPDVARLATFSLRLRRDKDTWLMLELPQISFIVFNATRFQ
jgi:hypothetical protein